MGGTFVSRLRSKLDRGMPPVCVGFDPRLDALPDDLLPQGSPVERIATFCREVLPAVAPHTPAIKPNVAFFERYGSTGFAAYEDLCQRARALDLLVVGDVKRGDIGPTAVAYADIHLDLADAVTLHPFLGRDGVAPFLERCQETGGAVFVLVRTSNPSAVELQAERLADGTEVSELVAARVHAWGEGLGPADDYGPVGAVVGATYPRQLAQLRRAMPRALILVPGVGAQGATLPDTMAAFDHEGMGGLVNQSRGILQCFAPTDRNWLARIAAAAQAFAADMTGALHTAREERAREGRA